MGKCHEKWTVRVTHSQKRDTKYGFIASPTSEKKNLLLKRREDTREVFILVGSVPRPLTNCTVISADVIKNLVSAALLIVTAFPLPNCDYAASVVTMPPQL